MLNWKNFWIFSLIFLGLTGFLKAWFYNEQVFENSGLQQIIYWSAVIILTSALVRRFGYITFLEALFVGVMWLVLSCLTDLLITAQFTSNQLFARPWYWWSYLVMAVSILLFHKKKHIHVRHELHHAATHKKH